jgi:cell division initiation protein
MKVTPLDLRQQRFKSVMRGFDRDEVTQFLSEVADDYEQALRDAERVREDLARTQAQLDELREHERNLRNTLLTAQRLADEIRGNAEQEAKRLTREAESRADLVLQKAQARLEDVQREVDNIRLKRKDAESSLESTISTLRNSLEFIRSQDAKEREEKLALHRPRPVEVSLPVPVPTLRAVDQGDVAQARQA